MLLDDDGHSWEVGAMPFFMEKNGTRYTSRTFVMLVFARLDSAEAPLADLRYHINQTTNSLIMQTVIIVVVSSLVILIVMQVGIAYITKPLETVRKVSDEIVGIMALEERQRDYSNAISEVHCTPTHVYIYIPFFSFIG